MVISTRGQASEGTASSRPRARYPLLLALLGLLTACDHRVASQKTLDVCALAMAPVSTLLREAPTSRAHVAPPSAGYCEFSAQPGPNGRRQVTVNVLTSASMAPDDLSRFAAIMLAELEQNHGDSSTKEFAELAKLGVAFPGPPANTREVIIGERGVLMQIGLSSTGFSQEEVSALVHGVWSGVLANKPPEP